jgi:hypothetical protein
VLECGRRRMTRVVGDVGQPRRMETCGAEEPYEGNRHVRFCGGSGRVIADPTRTADAQQPPLVPRFGSCARLRPGVRCLVTCCVTGYTASMITGFKHKGLERFFLRGTKAGIQPRHAARLRLILARLHASTCPQDMHLPGLDLHELKGNRQET